MELVLGQMDHERQNLGTRWFVWETLETQYTEKQYFLPHTKPKGKTVLRN